MGFYTALRVDCVVRPEYRAAIAHWMSVSRDWGQTCSAFPSFPCSGEFLADERRNFIPNGGNGYMPDGWHGGIPDAGGMARRTGDAKQFFDPESGQWIFACTLKNYTGTIAKFVHGLLFPATESVSVCEAEDEYGARTCFSRQADGTIVSHTTIGNDEDA